MTSVAEKYNVIAPSLFRRIEGYIELYSPYTSVVTLVRSVISLTLLFTFLFTPLESLFFRSLMYPTGVVCRGGELTQFSLFCWVDSSEWLNCASLISIMVLLVGISGFLPQLIGVPLWFVFWSFSVSSTVVDGGDQIAANLMLILAIYSVCDTRFNGWTQDKSYTSRVPIMKFFPYGVLGLAVVQIMGVYFQSSMAKIAVTEWADGSALWYWMQNPAFAPGAPLIDVILDLLSNPYIVVTCTYMVLAIQIMLCFAPFAGNKFRFLFLYVATIFHLVIAILFGLWSFSIVMIAADILLLTRPYEHVNMLHRWKKILCILK